MPHLQAVIGAGAAGLVAAKELAAEGHRVTVFEQGDDVGGVWKYTPDVEVGMLPWTFHRTITRSSILPACEGCRGVAHHPLVSNEMSREQPWPARSQHYADDVQDDPLGVDPARRRVHSSMYAGLRTNLPRVSGGFKRGGQQRGKQTLFRVGCF